MKRAMASANGAARRAMRRSFIGSGLLQEVLDHGFGQSIHLGPEFGLRGLLLCLEVF
jgi:hypothetical protein